MCLLEILSNYFYVFSLTTLDVGASLDLNEFCSIILRSELKAFKIETFDINLSPDYDDGKKVKMRKFR